MLNKIFEISSKQFEELHNLSKVDIKNKLYLDLINILEIKNGFFCFEQSLHFYSINEFKNVNKLINKILNTNNNIIFFAQDILCNQFCIKDNAIYFFDIESLEYEFICNNFIEWEEIILENYNYYTGFSLCHQWQIENGLLNHSERLNSIKMFILGGEYSIDNLFKCNYEETINSKIAIGLEILNLNDGDTILIK